MQEVVGARAAQGEQYIDGPEQHSLLPDGAIELKVVWGDNTLFVKQIEPRAGFTIGDSASIDLVDFVIPSEHLGSPVLSLISADSIGVYLHIPFEAAGTIRLAGEAELSVAALRERLPLMPDGSRQLCLQLGTRAALTLGALRIEVDCIRPEQPLARSFIGQAWQTTLPYFAASLLSVGSLLSTMAYLMPPLGITDGAGLERDQLVLMQQYLQSAAEREEQERQEEAGASSDAAGGQDGAKAAGEEGAMGATAAPAKNARAVRKGPRDNPEPRPSQLAEAATFGMIGLLRGGIADPDTTTAPWAREDALGNAELSAQGNMWGDEIADAAGANGLGLASLGDGGGGKYLGIGLSNVGTWGTSGTCPPGLNCSGLGDGRDGRSWGRPALTEHKAKDIVLRSATPVVSGRIPPHVIQRIVRQNFGRFRHCYEQGLGQNPNLQGRVSIRFLISSDGSVAQSGNAGSSLGDAGVVSCVVRSFYGLSFPKPEGGTVAVTYPIMFSPE